MKEESITKEAKGWEITRRIQQLVQGGRQRLADRLGSTFNGSSYRQQLFILLPFFLLCFSVSTWVLVRSLLLPSNPFIYIDAIRQPVVHPIKKRCAVLGLSEYNRLHTYRLQLDSGLQSGDTLLAHQRDTLLFLENLYLQQLKNNKHEKQSNN